MKKIIYSSAKWAAIAVSGALFTILTLCYIAAEEECDQLKENARAARVYVQFLEDAIDDLDDVFLGDVACETDAFCSYYETLPRDLVKVTNN